VVSRNERRALHIAVEERRDSNLSHVAGHSTESLRSFAQGRLTTEAAREIGCAKRASRRARSSGGEGGIRTEVAAERGVPVISDYLPQIPPFAPQQRFRKGWGTPIRSGLRGGANRTSSIVLFASLQKFRKRTVT
jgi:hypothetical protein